MCALVEGAVQTTGAAPELHRQHLIDPETCIRCNTCEETCPVKAITHDGRNYVVDPAKCASCLACIAPCPTGAIDNWRSVLRTEAYGVEAQLTWDALPGEKALGLPVAADAPLQPASAPAGAAQAPSATVAGANVSGATVPPWSASHPYVNLYTSREPAIATVVGNFRVTDAGSESDTHHIVLDFGGTPFPVLEGQSLGILPPGNDDLGRAHHARQYSIASPRDGERPSYNNVSLTVKRVTADHQGKPVRGVCSNYLCDLQRGETVRVIGPFGNTFLMPNHSPSHLLMICTGTGSAPMRAMTERRRRRREKGEGGRLLLFFGARTQQELPYFGPLMSLPKDFIDINLALSRTPGQPKRYVQDLMHERASAVAELLRDDNTCIYVCGLRGMEAGVLQAFEDIATKTGLLWEPLADRLRAEGRLHFETY
jgi:benzoyl-CoA 2,3-dioxygenase component A